MKNLILITSDLSTLNYSYFNSILVHLELEKHSIRALPLFESDWEKDQNLVLGAYDPEMIILFDEKNPFLAYSIRITTLLGKSRCILHLPSFADLDDDKVRLAFDRLEELL